MNRMRSFGEGNGTATADAAQVWAAEDSIGIGFAQGTPRVKRVILFLFLLTGCLADEPERAPETAQAPPPVDCVNDWTPVAAGIEYRMLNCTPSRFDLHLVRVDPKVAHIDAVHRPGSTAQLLGREHTFALNTNFFDEQFRPLGVIVSGGKQVNPPHPVSWQSVFYIDRDRVPHIVPVREWAKVKETATAAAQCGPRLVVGGEENEVARAEPTWRSGVCIDANKRVVFFATSPETELDVHETRTLAAKGMQCRDAMLFDGGPSVQMSLSRAGGGRVEVEGDKRVPAYVVAR
jgi:uncharacterized protein YigE (DUF2233 family)